MTVDSYCAEKGIQRIDVMKIDTEGSEPAVIRGAKRALEKNPGILLVVEMMDDTTTPGRYSTPEFFQEVLALGFKAYVPRGWPFPLQQIETYPENYFDNLFFLRVSP